MAEQDDVTRELLAAIDDKRMLVLATVVRAPQGAASPELARKLLVDEDQRVTGSLGDTDLDQRVVADALRAMDERKSHVASYGGANGASAAEAVQVFLEVVEPQPTLLVIGAGHIAVPIARMGKMLSFEVVVLDDREKFANRERFPDADQVIAADFGPTLAGMKITRAHYIVIITRGHQYDEESLMEVADSPAAYIGMIGSRRRVQAVRDNLAGIGFDPSKLDRVRAPIGLEIGAETPEEIGVSIIAEIISVRRGGRGLPMSEIARNRELRVAR